MVYYIAIVALPSQVKVSLLSQEVLSVDEVRRLARHTIVLKILVVLCEGRFRQFYEGVASVVQRLELAIVLSLGP